MSKNYCSNIDDICAFPSLECTECLHKTEVKTVTPTNIKLTTNYKGELLFKIGLCSCCKSVTSDDKECPKCKRKLDWGEK